MWKQNGKDEASSRSGFTRLRWTAADSETALLVLSLKGLVLFLAVLGIGTLFDQYDTWSTLWTRWDASHYFTLAENGYAAEGEGRFSIVFYPLYPWLVRAVAFVCRSYFGAALLVSGVASVCAALLFRRLVELDHPAKVARLAVWFLFIFPTAYFLHIGYTESLFLALVLGSFAGGAEAILGGGGRAGGARLPHPREWAFARAHFAGGSVAAISGHAPDRLALALDRSHRPRLFRSTSSSTIASPAILSRFRRSWRKTGTRRSRSPGSESVMSGSAFPL